MLVKTVFLICLMILTISSNIKADTKFPDVYILIQGTEPNEPSAAGYWTVPGSVPNLAGLLYGKTPLECGVVSDLDWRRKPIQLRSLADCYRLAGYHTSFFGEWGMGMQPPYDPSSRGFDTFWNEMSIQNMTLENVMSTPLGRREKILESMPQDKPWFCIIRQGKSGINSNRLMASVIKSRGRKNGVMITLNNKSAAIKPMHGYDGKLPNAQQRSIWEFYSDLVSFVGVDTENNPLYLIHHQGQWPLTDAPEKYRHRGSVVFSEKFALQDGLNLYPIISPLNFSKKETLDLATHVQVHQELLTAHSLWWKQASSAINNPRSFDVGGIQQISSKLTAMDWRPTTIIHKDGSALASQPMVYQDILEATLRGIRENKEYKQSFPAYSGSWSVNILRPGRYKITARLFPEISGDSEYINWGKLEGGVAHIKLGGNEVQLRIIRGASSVSVMMDADQGVRDLECWFTGQLSLERELGAFFVEIERVGDKKFKFQTKGPPLSNGK